MKSQGSPKVITIHAELDMSVYTKFHGNPSDSGCDILLKDTTVNLTVALEKNEFFVCQPWNTILCQSTW